MKKTISPFVVHVILSILIILSCIFLWTLSRKEEPMPDVPQIQKEVPRILEPYDPKTDHTKG